MDRMVAVIKFIELPQLSAGADIKERNHEEGDAACGHQKVFHRQSFLSGFLFAAIARDRAGRVLMDGRVSRMVRGDSGRMLAGRLIRFPSYLHQLNGEAVRAESGICKEFIKWNRSRGRLRGESDSRPTARSGYIPCGRRPGVSYGAGRRKRGGIPAVARTAVPRPR